MISLIVAMHLTTAADVRCLTLNAYHEARGEGLVGMAAVTHVVLNRVASPRWPASACAVVQQRHQFSWFGDGRSDAVQDQEAWRRARVAVLLVLEGTLEDPTGGATHYHARWVQPSWASECAPGPTLRHHVFYRECR